MLQDTNGGSTLRQSPKAPLTAVATATKSPDPSASVAQFPAAGKILLTDDEGAAALGVSPRAFAKLMHEPWFPKPVVLGPRLKRHVRHELEAAVAAMPRQAAPASEPAQLLRGRIERAKLTGSLT
jgi:predicted DNA-binding transcriptional regulator AlpA